MITELQTKNIKAYIDQGGKIFSKVIDTYAGYPCEIAYYDIDGILIGYYAYGAYDPDLPYKGEK